MNQSGIKYADNVASDIMFIICVNIHVLLKNFGATVVVSVFNMFSFMTLSLANEPVVAIATQ